MEEIGVEESETQREDEEARGSLKGKGYDAEMLSFYQQGYNAQIAKVQNDL